MGRVVGRVEEVGFVRSVVGVRWILRVWVVTAGRWGVGTPSESESDSESESESESKSVLDSELEPELDSESDSESSEVESEEPESESELVVSLKSDAFAADGLTGGRETVKLEEAGVGAFVAVEARAGVGGGNGDWVFRCF